MNSNDDCNSQVRLGQEQNAKNAGVATSRTGGLLDRGGMGVSGTGLAGNRASTVARLLLCGRGYPPTVGRRHKKPSRSSRPGTPSVRPRRPAQSNGFRPSMNCHAVTPASAESAAIEALLPVTAPAIAPPEGSGALTLDQAIAVGLQQNPTLVALRATQPVAEAALRVAQTYPFNPYVQVEVCPVDHELGTGQGAILNYVYLMQTLELAHQSRYREASAAAARNQVCWNVVHAELTNAAQTEKLYFTALYERDLRDLARLTAAQNERVLGIVERRFTAGTGMPTEQTTARVAARQSRKQAGLAESNFQTALLALKRQLNLDTNEPIALVGRFEDFNWMPVEGVEPDSADGTAPIRVSPQVVARLAGERPDVLAAQSGTSMAQANADLARANMVQNIAVGPYYERDDYGTLFLGLRAQVNLPIWDTGRPLANQTGGRGGPPGDGRAGTPRHGTGGSTNGD